MDNETSKNLLDDFFEKCREYRLSVTPQRLAIYKALMTDNTHPNPEKIHKAIKADFPTISLATVYKTLETFERNGIISVVTPIHNTVRYDVMTEHHHHIVCVRCKKIIDLESKELDALKIPDVVAKQNRLVDFSVHFNVICS
ncbi:MAG: transcriptional repressor, partial [Calditrichaeota bacterium]|nr:transcriptional repressor [Calditrichota bacterium]